MVRSVARATLLSLCMLGVSACGHVSANCTQTTVRAVYFRTRPDYVVDLSDGHSYQRDPEGTVSWIGRNMVKFSVGDSAYVCTNIAGAPRDELDVVVNPHEFDYGG